LPQTPHFSALGPALQALLVSTTWREQWRLFCIFTISSSERQGQKTGRCNCIAAFLAALVSGLHLGLGNLFAGYAFVIEQYVTKLEGT